MMRSVRSLEWEDIGVDVYMDCHIGAVDEHCSDLFLQCHLAQPVFKRGFEWLTGFFVNIQLTVARHR